MIQLWYGRNEDGTAADRLSQAEARALLAFLVNEQRGGRTVVTWNGAAFDNTIAACLYRRLRWRSHDVGFWG